MSVYQERFESLLPDAIEGIGPPSAVRDACAYALMGKGKRLRPALVWMVGDFPNCDCAALAVEFFHTASLIADDLPCMDDDDQRRERPSVHKVYGEATALLASYALIAAGYEQLARGPADVVPLAIERVSQKIGLRGVTGGQFADVQAHETPAENYFELALAKTGALFEISFLLGWIYSGKDPQKLPQVERAARHYGLLFQIEDDRGDVEQDRTNGAPNAYLILGPEGAQRWFLEEQSAFNEAIEGLGISAFGESLPEGLLSGFESAFCGS